MTRQADSTVALVNADHQSDCCGAVVEHPPSKSRRSLSNGVEALHASLV